MVPIMTMGTFLFLDSSYKEKGNKGHMQVIIDLHAAEPGVHHSNEEAERRWNIFRLFELLESLEEEGYEIHSLYGNFLFDNAHQEAIDIGDPGEIIHSSISLAKSIYETGGLLMVVFLEEKYVVFSNRYFLAIYLCHMRKFRPMSIMKAIKRFKQLFIQKRRYEPHFLYRRQFDEYYGIDARPVPTLQGDHVVHRHGFAIPGPILKEEEKEE